MPQLGVVTEYRYCAGQLERFRPETPQSHEYARGDGAGAKLEDGGRALLVGPHPTRGQFRRKPLQQEGVAARGVVTRLREGRRGVREAGLPELPRDRLGAQRARSQRRRVGVRRELVDERVAPRRIASSDRHDDRQRQAADALRQVVQEAQAHAIAPLRVVDREQSGPFIGEVRREPVEAVEVAVKAILVGAGTLEQRARRRRRPREQALPRGLRRSCQSPLEQLNGETERELALQLAAGRRQGLHLERARRRDGLLYETRLAEAGRGVDHRERSLGSAGAAEGPRHRPELVLSFQQRSAPSRGLGAAQLVAYRHWIQRSQKGGYRKRGRVIWRPPLRRWASRGMRRTPTRYCGCA